MEGPLTTQMTSKEVDEFKAVRSIGALAAALHISVKKLNFVLYGRGRPPYRRFRIPKRRVGQREIAAPPKTVQFLQSRLLMFMTAVVDSFPPPCHGFTANRSIVTNARVHAGTRHLLNIDLKSFFETVHFGRVRGIFNSKPFNFPLSVASVLAQLCCNGGVLPQGAPTSPMLANLACRKLDRDLQRLARRANCAYTRYADDLSFSTRGARLPVDILNSGPGAARIALGEALTEVIQLQGFAVNEAKSRARSARERMDVTGVVVNQKPNVQRSFVRNLRALLYKIEKLGIADTEAEYLKQYKHRAGPAKPSGVALGAFVKGKLDFLKMVRGEGDPMLTRYALRAQRALALYPRGFRVTKAAARDPHLLASAFWVLEGRDVNGDPVTQATAFDLDGVGLVTAYHTFTEHAAAKWVVFRADQTDREFECTGYHPWPQADVAVVIADHPVVGVLRRSSARVPAQGASLTVAGYPAWYPGSTQLWAKVDAHLSEVKEFGGATFLLASTPMKAGGSGGAMLDAAGEVVAVALCDHDHKWPNAGALVGHVDVARLQALVTLPF
jgi:RNA-directed DNA polymerase